MSETETSRGNGTPGERGGDGSTRAPAGETTEPRSGEYVPRIGIAMVDERNRTLLSEWLARAYDVATLRLADVSPTKAADNIDLLILDGASYARHEQWLTDYKSDLRRSFQPVLLFVPETTSTVPDVHERVDDVVSMPTQKAVLEARISGLLDRRRLSRAVAEREDRFRTLFETGPDPALVVTADGTVTDSNAAFREFLGISREAANGRRLDEFEAFGDAAVDAMTAVADAAADRRTITYQSADGTRHAECRLSGTLDDSTAADACAEHIVILRDITDELTYKRDLERQVDRLDEFASMLAHDLRNPLGIANGWLEEAEASGDSIAFERVDSAHDRMRCMIDDLLALARMGEVISDRTVVSVPTVAAEAWDSVGTAEATLRVADDLADAVVEADADRLQDAFTNLFRNGVEHGSTGRDGETGGAGDELTIEVGSLEKGFYVEDDGSGFGSTDPERLFESGYTTDAEGTGFGLAIVRQVVEAHEWTVHATDADAGGARFEITGVETLRVA